MGVESNEYDILCECDRLGKFSEESEFWMTESFDSWMIEIDGWLWWTW